MTKKTKKRPTKNYRLRLVPPVECAPVTPRRKLGLTGFLAYTILAVMTLSVLVGLAVAFYGCAHPNPPVTPKKDVLSQTAFSSVLIEVSSTRVVDGYKEEFGALGSGTVIWTDSHEMSLVLSCHHVVYEDALKTFADQIVVSSSRGGTGTGTVYAYNENSDLALLIVAGALDAPALPIAKTEPVLYDRLLVIGSHAGFTGTAADAILSAKKVKFWKRPLWQLTSFIFPGVSGGTVTNLDGELVAVPQSVIVQGGAIIPQIGFAVPLPEINKLLREIHYDNRGKPVEETRRGN